jgi:uncharacterized repeat protein (TIGR03943 family)
MVAVVNRQVSSVLLVLVGGAVLRISVGDTYLRYVKPSMRPYLLVSGVILVLLGVLLLIDILRQARHHEVHEDDESYGMDETAEVHDAHGHVHPGSSAAWLLVLPVLAIFLIAPPALGAFTAERATAAVVDTGSAPPLPPGNPVSVGVGDFASRAVWDNGSTLKGRTVTMLGFVTPGKVAGTWYLTRLTLTCCAADAVTSKVLMVGPPSSPATSTWVNVVGQWTPGGGINSETAIPWLQVTSVTPVSQPANPYE